MFNCFRYFIVTALTATWLCVGGIVLVDTYKSLPEVRCDSCPQTEQRQTNQANTSAIIPRQQPANSSDEQGNKTSQTSSQQPLPVGPMNTFLYLNGTEWQAVIAAIALAFFAGQICIYMSMHATTKRVERAYVYVENIISFKDYFSLTEPHVQVLIINSGKTPAKILGMGAAMMHVTPNDPLPRYIPIGEEHLTPADFHMVTQQRSVYGFKLGHVTEEQFVAMNDHENTKMRMLICGRIKYRDRFQRHTESRYTNFTFEYDFTGSNFHRIGGGIPLEKRTAVFNVARDAYNQAD